LKRTGIPTSHLPSGNLVSLPTNPTSLAKAQQTVHQIGFLWSCKQDQTRYQQYQSLERSYQVALRQWRAKYDTKTSKSAKKAKTKAPPAAPRGVPRPPASCPTQGAGG
jgi:hypothetical protein